MHDKHLVVPFDEWYNDIGSRGEQGVKWKIFLEMYQTFLDRAHIHSEARIQKKVGQPDLQLADALDIPQVQRVFFSSQKQCYVLLDDERNHLQGFMVFESFKKLHRVAQEGQTNSRYKRPEWMDWPDEFIYLNQVYAPHKGQYLLNMLFDQYPEIPVVLEVENPILYKSLKDRYVHKYKFHDMVSKEVPQYVLNSQIYQFVSRCLHSGNETNNPTRFQTGEGRRPTIDSEWSAASRWLVRPALALGTKKRVLEEEPMEGDGDNRGHVGVRSSSRAKSRPTSLASGLLRGIQKMIATNVSSPKQKRATVQPSNKTEKNETRNSVWNVGHTSIVDNRGLFASRPQNYGVQQSTPLHIHGNNHKTTVKGKRHRHPKARTSSGKKHSQKSIEEDTELPQAGRIRSGKHFRSLSPL